jgi:hypothetical protein
MGSWPRKKNVLPPRRMVIMIGLIVTSGSWLSACGVPQLTQTPQPTGTALASTWDVTQSEQILHIAYGNGISFPEYAALHFPSSYFRLNFGPPSGWGTSIILLPVFWSKQSCPPPGLCQGALVKATWHTKGADLLLSVKGTIGGLHASVVIDLKPPVKNAINAQIAVEIKGGVMLDVRPGEAFKLVMLSSMHVSSTQWDTRLVSVKNETFPLPENGWIIHPPIVAQSFGLQGGMSAWKAHAPTVTVIMDRTEPVTGWITQSSNPNDDNVGFWAAADTIVSSYSYSVKVSP